jgi:hypothetical protein
MLPSEHAADHLEAHLRAVLPTARVMLRLMVPQDYIDHFPVSADDLIQVAWLRLLEKEKRELDAGSGSDSMLRTCDGLNSEIKAYLRFIALEVHKARNRRSEAFKGLLPR